MSSGTYTFGQLTELDDLIRDACERAGVPGPFETGMNVESAIRSGNLELASWADRGLNLWMIQQLMLGLQPGRITYNVPSYVVQVLQAIATTPRVLPPLLGGTPAYRGTVADGNVANPFILGNTTGVALVAQGPVLPAISWTFPESVSVMYVGVLLSPDQRFNAQFDIQASWSTQSPIPADSWVTLYRAEARIFLPGETVWWVLPNPVTAPNYQIQLVGSVDFSVNSVSFIQVYFATPPANQTPTGIPGGNSLANDLVLQPQCRYDYLSLPTRMQPTEGTNATTFLYYFNAQTKPTLSLFPAPSDTSKPALLYVATCYAQDLVKLAETAGIPARFYDALVAGIALRLAIKFTPDRVPMLAPQAEQAYALAANADSEKGALSIGLVGG